MYPNHDPHALAARIPQDLYEALKILNRSTSLTFLRSSLKSVSGERSQAVLAKIQLLDQARQQNFALNDPNDPVFTDAPKDKKLKIAQKVLSDPARFQSIEFSDYLVSRIQGLSELVEFVEEDLELKDVLDLELSGIKEELAAIKKIKSRWVYDIFHHHYSDYEEMIREVRLQSGSGLMVEPLRMIYARMNLGSFLKSGQEELLEERYLYTPEQRQLPLSQREIKLDQIEKMRPDLIKIRGILPAVLKRVEAARMAYTQCAVPPNKPADNFIGANLFQLLHDDYQMISKMEVEFPILSEIKIIAGEPLEIPQVYDEDFSGAYHPNAIRRYIERVDKLIVAIDAAQARQKGGHVTLESQSDFLEAAGLPKSARVDFFRKKMKPERFSTQVKEMASVLYDCSKREFLNLDPVLLMKKNSVVPGQYETYYNGLTYFIDKHILEQTDLKSRSLAWEFWVHVAYELKERRDYSSLMLIVCTLQHYIFSINLPKSTHLLLSASAQSKMAELKSLCELSNNTSKLRKAIEVDPKAIPCMSLIFKDVTIITDTNDLVYESEAIQKIRADLIDRKAYLSGTPSQRNDDQVLSAITALKVQAHNTKKDEFDKLAKSYQSSEKMDAFVSRLHDRRLRSLNTAFSRSLGKEQVELKDKSTQAIELEERSRGLRFTAMQAVDRGIERLLERQPFKVSNRYPILANSLAELANIESVYDRPISMQVSELMAQLSAFKAEYESVPNVEKFVDQYRAEALQKLNEYQTYLQSNVTWVLGAAEHHLTSFIAKFKQISSESIAECVADATQLRHVEWYLKHRHLLDLLCSNGDIHSMLQITIQPTIPFSSKNQESLARIVEQQSYLRTELAFWAELKVMVKNFGSSKPETTNAGVPPVNFSDYRPMTQLFGMLPPAIITEPAMVSDAMKESFQTDLFQIESSAKQLRLSYQVDCKAIPVNWDNWPTYFRELLDFNHHQAKVARAVPMEKLRELATSVTTKEQNNSYLKLATELMTFGERLDPLIQARILEVRTEVDAVLKKFELLETYHQSVEHCRALMNQVPLNLEEWRSEILKLNALHAPLNKLHHEVVSKQGLSHWLELPEGILSANQRAQCETWVFRLGVNVADYRPDGMQDILQFDAKLVQQISLNPTVHSESSIPALVEKTVKHHLHKIHVGSRLGTTDNPLLLPITAIGNRTLTAPEVVVEDDIVVQPELIAMTTPTPTSLSANAKGYSEYTKMAYSQLLDILPPQLPQDEEKKLAERLRQSVGNVCALMQGPWEELQSKLKPNYVDFSKFQWKITGDSRSRDPTLRQDLHAYLIQNHATLTPEIRRALLLFQALEDSCSLYHAEERRDILSFDEFSSRFILVNALCGREVTTDRDQRDYETLLSFSQKYGYLPRIRTEKTPFLHHTIVSHHPEDAQLQRVIRGEGLFGAEDCLNPGLAKLLRERFPQDKTAYQLDTLVQALNNAGYFFHTIHDLLKAAGIEYSDQEKSAIKAGMLLSHRLKELPMSVRNFLREQYSEEELLAISWVDFFKIRRFNEDLTAIANYLQEKHPQSKPVVLPQAIPIIELPAEPLLLPKSTVEPEDLNAIIRDLVAKLPKVEQRPYHHKPTEPSVKLTDPTVKPNLEAPSVQALDLVARNSDLLTQHAARVEVKSGTRDYFSPLDNLTASAHMSHPLFYKEQKLIIDMLRDLAIERIGAYQRGETASLSKSVTITGTDTKTLVGVAAALVQACGFEVQWESETLKTAALANQNVDQLAVGYQYLPEVKKLISDLKSVESMLATSKVNSILETTTQKSVPAMHA